MTDTTESRWYKIIVFIVSAIFVGFSIANIVYYNRIRTGTCAAVTSGEATTLMWLNIALLVIAGLIFLWSLWRLIFSHNTRAQVQQYFTSPERGAAAGYTYRGTSVARNDFTRRDVAALAAATSQIE